MNFATRASLFLATLLVAVACQAQNATVFEEQGQLVRASRNLTALGPDLMGDKVNLYTGTVEFSQTDVSLPGNNALPVSVGRRYVAGIQRLNFYEGLFVDWDLEIPHLHGVYAAGNATRQGWVVWPSSAFPSPLQRCSNFGAPPDAATPTYAIIEPDQFWGGHFLYVPGAGDEKMRKRDPANTTQPTDGYSYPIVTKSNWQLRCITGLASPKTVNGTEPTGEGFVARSPDGTQYVFNWMVSRRYRGIGNSTGGVARQEVWILPTLVTDRFGNTVTYNYDTVDPWKLTSIVASDGRTIALSYGSGHRVASVFDGTRTWTYAYDATRLTGVTLPDGSAWSFNLNEQTASPVISPTNRCSGNTYSDGTLMPKTQTNTITHPSGAVGSFVMSFVMHGRSGSGLGSGTPCPGWMPDWPTPAYGVRSLISKSISGPGIPGLTWFYNWGPPNGAYSCLPASCPNTKTLTVLDPRGFQTRYTFGNRYQTTEGQLQQVDEGWDGTNALRRTVSTYRAAGAGPYPNMQGYSGSEGGDELMESLNLPLESRTIAQQGASFSWQATAWDTTATQVRVTGANRSSTLGYSKSETTAYSHNTAKWVMGQVASRSVGAIVAASTSYNLTTALPTATYEFGKLKASYAFNPDGTLYTLTDGAGHTTTFSNYNRGLAQDIAYADGASEHASVDNLGLVRTLRNGFGTTTTYDYDAMGRLQLIVPPADPVGWNPTTIVYAQVATDEYGLGANHWRQTITTGAGVTINYFDAMLRKRVSSTSDTNNPAATQRAQLFHYDADNRNVFTSYPARTVPPVTDPPPLGSTTLFDALGRPYQTNADSELGVLTSRAQYLSCPTDCFRKKETNPRGYVTITSYQAFDQPSESAPVSITAPEGLMSVAIGRDVFDKPLSITRSGPSGGGTVSATRSYVYDANQLLCKTVEPETGATIQFLDGANNVAWRASGLSLTGTASCDTGSVPAASKVTYTYDGRNRLWNTAFGDGSPSIARTYWGDGLPKTVISNGSTWTYSYNNRRLPIQESLSYGATYAIGWAYDANGHVSQLTYPADNSAVAYSPNALGEATQVGSYASAVSYQPNGAVAGYTLGNGIVHTQTQNTRGLPWVNRDAGVMQDLYTYDANGNLTAITDQQEGGITSRTMGYDGLDRLISASGIWGAGSFTYDALDNLRTSTVGARSLSHYIDAATNRLTSLSGSQNIGLGYDANGNVTLRGGQGFVFDMANRLASAAGKASYAYDGHGRRTWLAYADGSIKLQVYAQAGKLLYSQHSTQGSTKHIYLGDRLIAEVNSATGTSFSHTDALGSPVARTNNAVPAQLLSRTRYEPYGATAAGANPTGVGFTGHVNDADTGLVYMQQRYYDPVAGRFLSVDPVTTDANTGSAFNRYVYANNNPYRYTDPDGRISWSTCAQDSGNCTNVGSVSGGRGRYGLGSTAIGSTDNRGSDRSSLLAAAPNYDTDIGGGGGGGRGAGAASTGLGSGGIGGGVPASLSIAAKGTPLLLNGPIRATEQGMAHVVERHTVNDIAKFAGKSKFNEGENLSALVNSGTQQRMVQQANGNFARTWDGGRSIGIDRVTGQQTSAMTVITRQNGELVTAFPGRP